MVNYLSSTTQLAPLFLASAATALPVAPDTTLILTLTYIQPIISFFHDKLSPKPTKLGENWIWIQCQQMQVFFLIIIFLRKIN